MAYAVVQNTNNGNGVASPSLGVSFTNTPAQNNLCLCSVDNIGSNVQPSVSDTGGAWTLLNGVGPGALTRGLWLFGKIATAAQPKLVTVTAGTSGDTLEVALYEVSGNPPTVTGLVDKAATANAASGISATTTNTNQPSVVTQSPGALLITSLGVSSNITAPSVSTGSGGGTAPGLQQSVAAGAIRLVDAMAIETAKGTYNPFFSWSTARNWIQITTALVAAAGPGAGSSGFAAFFP